MIDPSIVILIFSVCVLAVGGEVYLLYRRVREAIADAMVLADGYDAKRESSDNILRVGILAESNSVRARLRMFRDELGTELREAITHFDSQAACFKTHAEDLRNHAKQLTDEAHARSEGRSRSVPTR